MGNWSYFTPTSGVISPQLITGRVLRRRKQLILFEGMTAQGADFPQSRSDFEGVIGIEGASLGFFIGTPT